MSNDQTLANVHSVDGTTLLVVCLYHFCLYLYYQSLFIHDVSSDQRHDKSDKAKFITFRETLVKN